MSRWLKAIFLIERTTETWTIRDGEPRTLDSTGSANVRRKTVNTGK
jgi:hypothetical protein